MITIYLQQQGSIQSIEISDQNSDLLKEALWIDLYCPTKEEENLVETHVDFNIPTRDEMQEIEPSSRLYEENNNLFMTVTMIEGSKTPEPKSEAVTFVLTPKTLITIRYIDPRAFILMTKRLAKVKTKKYSANLILTDLLEFIVDRLADILRIVSENLDKSSQIIFRTKRRNSGGINYHKLLQNIGKNGDLEARARESLVSFNRLVSYLVQQNKQLNLKIVANDIVALSDHASFLANKVSFLLNATLGLVNIEQNNIIKIFSVAAVIFLPPTLIASVYGMNFQFMPELHWSLGYPFALLIMVFSAIVPYMFFKSRKWL